MDYDFKNLPVHERIRLLEELWDSIAADQNSIPLSSAQKAELDKRLAAYELTKDPGRPADEVISEIRKKMNLLTILILLMIFGVGGCD